MVKTIKVQMKNNKNTVNQLLTWGGGILPTKKLDNINIINYGITNRNISIFS